MKRAANMGIWSGVKRRGLSTIIMVVLRATRQKRDLLVDGRKNASEQDKLWR
jgi:hypothetical protein